jgi:hypothetical protein
VSTPEQSAADLKFSHAGLFTIALSLVVFLGWQVKQSYELRTSLRQLITQRTTLLTEAEVKQARTSKQLEMFLNDVLILAKTDPQIKALADRFGIKRNAAPAPAPAAE